MNTATRQPRQMTATFDFTPRTPWLRPGTTEPSEIRADGECIDWFAVELAANGKLTDPRTLTDAEREEAWRLMLTRGLSYLVVGARTGAERRLVAQWAKTHGLGTEVAQ